MENCRNDEKSSCCAVQEIGNEEEMRNHKKIIRFDGCILAIQSFFGSLDQRERPRSTSRPKIVIINGPEHDSAQRLFIDEMRLFSDDAFVIESDPKFITMRIGTHDTRVRSFNLPAVLLFYGLTDFIVGQIPILFGALASGSGTVSGTSDFVRIRID